MKKVLKITVLILVYLFLCGKSCQDDRDIVTGQLEEVEALKDNIREEFGTDYLTEESKYAVEMTAIQKVKDMADYIHIFSDQELDTSFRQKAGEMIRDMFISEKARLTFGPYRRNNSMKYLTVEEFLDGGIGDDIISLDLIYNAVKINVPLKRSGPDEYEGRITGIQKLTLFTSSDTLTFFNETITVSIHASKEAKIFGKDTLKTWAVKLGDMTKVH